MDNFPKPPDGFCQESDAPELAVFDGEDFDIQRPCGIGKRPRAGSGKNGTEAASVEMAEQLKKAVLSTADFRIVVTVKNRLQNRDPVLVFLPK